MNTSTKTMLNHNDRESFVRRDLDCAIRIMTVVSRKDPCSQKMYDAAVNNYASAASVAYMMRKVPA